MRSLKNAEAKGAALLLLVIGSVGGAVGGGAAGVHLGRRMAASAGGPDRLRPTSAVPLAKDAAPVKPPLPVSVPNAGVVFFDGGNNSLALRICVEVRDAGDRAVAGALISAKAFSRPALPKAQNPDDRAVGELGVFAGPLPFPQDIIDGRYAPLGISRPVAKSGEGELRSDEKGRACLQLHQTGHIQITASTPERTATQEIVLPANPQGSAEFDLILRLAEPLDALCRLIPSTSPTADAESEPPSSDVVGPELSGRVVDGRGFAISAVRLEATVGRQKLVAISDSAGGFRVAGLPRGALSLRAQFAGYAPAQLSRRADEPRSDLQITLRPGGGIAGILRDGRRGILPSGAQLTLITNADGGATAISLSPDGSFSATGLPAGPATLRARAPGYAPLLRTLQIPAGEAPAQITLRDLRLDLEAGASLVGQVRGPTGAAVGATIEVLDRDGTALAKTTTDEHGDFRLNDLPASRLRITAWSSQGRGETWAELRADAQERVYFEIR